MKNLHVTRKGSSRLNMGGVSNSYGHAPYYPFKASGGTLIVDGDYKVHIFTSSGTLTVNEDVIAECLIVGGGGSGGAGVGGGGGGGGVYATSVVLAEGEITITVGGGGTAPASNTYGNKGSNSSIGSDLVAYGGGGGGYYQAYSGTYLNGGSGGGVGHYGGTGGTGVECQGCAGGSETWGCANAAGGGGGGGESVDLSYPSGAGGSGIVIIRYK